MTRNSCEKKISKIESALRGLRDNENEGREHFVKYFTKLIKHLFRKYDRPEVERLLSKKNPNLEHNINFFVEELARNVFDRRCNTEHSARFRSYQKDIVRKLVKQIRISSDKGRLELQKSLEGAVHDQYNFYKQFTQARWEDIIRSVKTNDVLERNKDAVFTGEEVQAMIDRMIDIQLLLIGCNDEKSQTILRQIILKIITNSDLKSKLTANQKKEFYELRRTCQQGGETYHEPSIENLQKLLESIVYLFPNSGHNITRNNINELINAVRGDTEQIQRYYDSVRGILWNLIFTDKRAPEEKIKSLVDVIYRLWNEIISPELTKLSSDVKRKPDSSEYDYLLQLLSTVKNAQAALKNVAETKCKDGQWKGMWDSSFNVLGRGTDWARYKCDKLPDDAHTLGQIIEHIIKHVASTTYNDVKQSVQEMSANNVFDNIDKLIREDKDDRYKDLKVLFDNYRKERFTGKL